MDSKIKLLDCTLRDGCHINKGDFGKKVITGTIADLVEANVDIIEIGFFDNGVHDDNSCYYSSIAEVKRNLQPNHGKSMISLMADFVDVSNVEPYDGTVDIFRLSFKRHRWEWAIDAATKLIDKGYKVYINPVNCNVYSDEQYLECIHKVNELKPYGFSIVDTFGVLRKQDLSRLYYMVEGNLDPEIVVGLHLHENLGLAYSLAQHFLEIRSPRRNVSVDCSLLGMGRTPGNLCAEQIMDHLNINFGGEYNLEPALDASDDFIAPIKREHPWGYAIPYALSGKYGLHRTYAEYLMGKNRLKTKDIQRILSMVSKDHIEMFDEAYIEGLYRDYMSVAFDDTEMVKRLSEVLSNKKVLVVCPGASINDAQAIISETASDDDTVTISVNFLPGFIKPDYVFCANAKRVQNIQTANETKRIVTSNLLEAAMDCYEMVVSYNDCVYFNEVFCEDSTLMLLKLLQRCGCKDISIAGFDGFGKNSTRQYYDACYTQEKGVNITTKTVRNILSGALESLKLHFITPSAYQEK